MVKKSSPLEKASRMLDLVPYIHAHQGISLTDLAQEFSISQGELVDDLTSLWMCGENKFDYMDLSFDSGYVFIRNAETLSDTRSLSQQERISLLLGLALIASELPEDRPDLLHEVEYLKKVLGEDFASVIEAKPAVPSNIYLDIERAISSRRSLQISYHSIADDDISDRVVHPLVTYQRDGHWYLQAYCEKAESHRTFRLDRISSSQILEASARTAPLISQEPHLQAVVTIHRELRHSLERLGQVQPTSQSQYVMNLFNHQWLVRTAISAAGAIEVIDPASIRSEIHERAQAIRSLYL